VGVDVEPVREMVDIHALAEVVFAAEVLSALAEAVEATARMFACEGAKVVIADMLEHEGRQMADAMGASARFEPLDVTKEDDWAAVVAATAQAARYADAAVPESYRNFSAVGRCRAWR
jgi:23S rRNA U2552 (ribose-2'-O)-methylase RlmE/FtsJ